jgi:single-strand DNA-binding protein
VNVTAFRALGVNLSNSLKKGEPVIVYGRMRINQWVNGEKSGTTVEIDAYNVGHDLSWGRTTFTKVTKAQLNQSDRMGDPAVQDAADQLDRDAAMVEAELLEDDDEDDDEPSVEGFADRAGGGIRLESADTDRYETVGAGSH